MQLRQNDDFGSGGFGASRGGRPHLGADYIVSEGETIYAPFDMEVKRVSYPYEGDLSLKGIALYTKVDGVHYDGRIFYFTPDANIIGRTITKGTRIGVAQTLQKKYPGITDHIHVQLRTTKEVPDSINYNGWYYINPENV